MNNFPIKIPVFPLSNFIIFPKRLFNSVKGDDVINQLERAGGKFVELRYKEYLHPLPWRGASEFVVHEVIEIRDPGGNKTSDLPVNEN